MSVINKQKKYKTCKFSSQVDAQFFCNFLTLPWLDDLPPWLRVEITTSPFVPPEIQPSSCISCQKYETKV